MKYDCIIYIVAVFMLSLGACTSDINDSTMGGASGFGATEGNTLLAGQGDQTNDSGSTATSDFSNDTSDSTTESAGGFGTTEGNTLLAGQGGQTNDGGLTATSGQDVAIESSASSATGDAAETVDGSEANSKVVDDSGVDSGVADDIVVEEGQVLLPRPTGRYRVGLSERVMTPGAGPVGNADGPVDLYTPYFTRIFYPIDPAYEGERFKISSTIASLLCGTPDQVLTHSYTNANMVPGTDRFPVVLFAPELSAPINFYVSMLEDLASHGYIVVAFQPEETIPDMSSVDLSSVDLPVQPAHCAPKEEWTAFYEAQNELWDSPAVFQAQSAPVALWVADAVHTLDQIEQLDQQDPAGILTSRLDLEKVGVFGHSIGGATAREACMTDPRFKACGSLDGSFFGERVYSPMERPLMIQTGGGYDDMKWKRFALHAGYIDVYDPTVQAVWDMTKDASAYRIVIRDVAHQSFTDMNIALQHFILGDAPAGDAVCVSLLLASLWMNCITKEDFSQYQAGTLDPVRAINISKTYTRAFFDKHLKGVDQDLLKGPSPSYPEVTFEAKNP